MNHPTPPELVALLADELAQEIRRVDGSHTLGAGALAEALAPFIIDVSTRAATVPQGVLEDARRFRDLVGWYEGLKLSRAETVCDLLGLPEADAMNAGFDDLVDAYAENRDAALASKADGETK